RNRLTFAVYYRVHARQKRHLGNHSGRDLQHSAFTPGPERADRAFLRVRDKTDLPSMNELFEGFSDALLGRQTHRPVESSISHDQSVIESDHRYHVSHHVQRRLPLASSFFRLFAALPFAFKRFQAELSGVLGPLSREPLARQ